jgi:hypothetical protein
VSIVTEGFIVERYGLRLNAEQLGLALPALETGTMNRSASILMQAGFNSRVAVIKRVTDTAPHSQGYELRAWLRSPEDAAVAAQPAWPTPKTRALWLDFVEGFAPRDNRTWFERSYRADVQWHGVPAPPGTPLTLHHWNGQPHVLSADGLVMVCHERRLSGRAT